MQTMAVSEYAKKEGVVPSTIYRRIEKGVLQSIIEDNIQKVIIPGQWHDDSKVSQNANLVLQYAELKAKVNQLESEKLELLRVLQETQEGRKRADEIIQQMQADASEAQQRSDTIILQLTRQFDEQTKLLEDLRQKQDAKWYQRLFRR